MTGYQLVAGAGESLECNGPKPQGSLERWGGLPQLGRSKWFTPAMYEDWKQFQSCQLSQFPSFGERFWPNLQSMFSALIEYLPDPPGVQRPSMGGASWTTRELRCAAGGESHADGLGEFRSRNSAESGASAGAMVPWDDELLPRSSWDFRAGNHGRPWETNHFCWEETSHVVSSDGR